MALTTHSSQIYKLPHYSYIDATRWLPHLSAFTRHILLAAHDVDASATSLQTLTFSPSQNTSTLDPQASISVPSRIASLKIAPAPLTPSKPLIAAATFSGSVLFYSADLIEKSLNFEFSAPDREFHSGAVSGIDLSENGSECVSVGKDGRVNLVNLSAKGGFRRVFDSNGLVSYSSVKWASPVEFVTGAFGFGLHWWDQREAGGPVALFKNNRTEGTASGIIHSIDIHPARKHTCLVIVFMLSVSILVIPSFPLSTLCPKAGGGSSGVVFAWDIRWPKQPVVLSGVATANSLVESDVWEDVICSLEWESIAILTRP
ncbi:nuclear pore complex protein nup43 [Phtheirospermum japonicum]|uniref:Nuclear pore complex protein nup43 n=1 Tax=Phtheirospermum japonicum TaxID=374723 RepID=A0A830CT96_9LAMI|nr:nuclear pore complex protein nup43 [Phtheirospermum japonicum]